ncbi:MAG: hypothetical protein GXO58_03540, partial [Thermodesulfobacteria bacterium]|nr:hypothetical protein [Thermodesulfobacteriota bacterium]
YGGKRLGLKALSLRVGSSKLDVTGWLDERGQDVDFALKSPDISQLYPDAGGRLDISGVIRGTRKEPNLKARLDGRSLRLSSYKVDSFKGAINLEGLSNSKIDSSFKTKGLRLDKLNLGRLVLTIRGKRFNHYLNLSVSGGDIDARLSLLGGFDTNMEYDGLVKGLRIKPLDFPAWSLEHEAQIAVSGSGLELSPLCLIESGEKGHLCLSSKVRKNFLTLNLDGKNIPLEPIAKHFTKTLILYGYSDINLNLQRSGRQIRGMVAFKTQDSRLKFASSGKNYPLNLSLDGKITESALTATLNGSLSDNFTVTGLATIPGFGLGEQNSDGNSIHIALDLKGKSLTIFQDFIPGLYVHSGTLDARVNVSGTRKSPNLNIRADIEHLRAEYPDYGLDIRSKEARLRVKNGKVSMLARLDSKDGPLLLKAQGELTPERHLVTCTVNGEDYRLVTTPYLKVDVSPRLKISWSGKKIDIRGNVLVPKARIRQMKLPPSAVVPSPDIVIKGQEPPKRRVPLAIYVKVGIKAGDKVTIDAYGLKGRLDGDVVVTMLPNSPLLLSGILSVEDGTYTAFGTELEIQKGRVIYFSTPPDNPRVEVDAIRNVGDTLVGVRIRGSLKNPEVKLFSDPPMPESEIARYLLGGGSGEGFGKASVITSGANLLISKIRQKLGMFDVLKLQTEENPDDIALIVGTYLRPDLYLKFINDFGDKMTRIILRYEFSKHIEIETETGDSPSAEIFFKIER